MYQEFEKRLKKKGVTLYRVSKDTGICVVTLYNWKNGKSTPKAVTLSKLADYLDMDVSKLIGG